jgi:hypothetical protein
MKLGSGVVVVSPIIWRSERRFQLAFLAFVGGVILDIDHVVAAGSIRTRSLEQLDQRSVTHSLLFVAVLVALAFLATRRILVAWGCCGDGGPPAVRRARERGRLGVPAGSS